MDKAPSKLRLSQENQGITVLPNMPHCHPKESGPIIMTPTANIRARKVPLQQSIHTQREEMAPIVCIYKGRPELFDLFAIPKKMHDGFVNKKASQTRWIISDTETMALCICEKATISQLPEERMDSLRPSPLPSKLEERVQIEIHIFILC